MGIILLLTINIIKLGDINLTVHAETTYSIWDLKHSIVEQSLQVSQY